MERIFYSKVGNIYYLLIVLFGALMIYNLWFKQLFFGILFMLVTYRMISMLTHLRYVLTSENQLRIETGRAFPHRTIAIADIYAVYYTRRKFKYFCGMSFDQLGICYRQEGKEKCFFISPLNREEMIKALIKRNENIKIENLNR